MEKNEMKHDEEEMDKNVEGGGEGEGGKTEVTEEKKDKKTRKRERKEQREREKGGFVWARQTQRFVALRVAYLGASFDGFAQQTMTKNTVEEHLHNAFHEALLVSDGRRDEPDVPQPRDYAYSRCGRTDKGVSAFGQVVALRVRSKLARGHGIIQPAPAGGARYAAPTAEAVAAAEACAEPADDAHEIDYCGVLNARLPPEIRVTGWAPVSSTFNARYGCTYRHYKYFLVAGGAGTSPAAPLDVAAMREACRAFVGQHDFRNYCKADLVNIECFVRDIYEASVDPVDTLPPGTLYCFSVKGSGFLWHQVRCMASVLLMVGHHEEPPSIAATLLDIARCPGKPSYPPASDLPLVLYDCGFEPALRFIAPAKPLNNVWCTFQKMWSRAVQTLMLTTLFLDTLDTLPVVHTLPRVAGKNRGKTSNSGDGEDAAAAAAAAGGERTAVMPLAESRERVYRDGLARKERSASGKQGVRPGGLKRSLEDLSAEARTLSERVAQLSGNKRAKYEAKQQKRDDYARRTRAQERDEESGCGGGDGDGNIDE